MTSDLTPRPALAAGIGALILLLLSLQMPAIAQSITYIHTDALGTPVATTDSDRNLIEVSEYEPYGKLLNRPLTDAPGFTGHVSDTATGLSYMQQRYYDPGIARFLSVDPVTAKRNTGANFNRYWYADNNPYKFTDPDGRCADGASCEAMGQTFASNPEAMKPLAPYAIAAVGVMAAASGFGEAAALVKTGVAIYKALSDAPKTELVQRAMSRDELQATEATGLVRGGRGGTHHVSDSVNSTAGRAQQRLALPQTPQVRATLEVPAGRFSAPVRVQPKFNMPGGGTQRTATGAVPARVVKTDELTP